MTADARLAAPPYVLRPLVPNDADAFVAAVRESAATVGRWLPWARADYARHDAVAWIDRCDAARADGSAYEFGVFLDDATTLVGGAGLNRFDPLHASCNLGYWVRTSLQRRGVATAATRALLRFAFERLDLVRVEIVAAEGNEGSAAVARKVGATHECLARSRLVIAGTPVAAHVFSVVAAALPTR